MTVLLQLFWSFLQVGAFSVGGGYAAMPLIRAQVCELHPWLTETDFSHLVTIAEMTPGPISINSATFVGIQIAGIPGAVAATLGCILPSCLIVSALAWLYRKYGDVPLMRSAMDALRPVVAALIAGAGLSLLQNALLGEQGTLNTFDWTEAVLAATALVLLRKKKWSPIPTMLLCGAGYLAVRLLLP